MESVKAEAINLVDLGTSLVAAKENAEINKREMHNRDVKSLFDMEFIASLAKNRNNGNDSLGQGFAPMQTRIVHVYNW